MGPASAGIAAPRALLLDFGGVIADCRSTPGDAAAGVVPLVAATLAAAGRPPLSAERITADVAAGLRRAAELGDAACAEPAPTELDHATFWSDLVAGGWPAGSRAAVRAAAGPLSHRLGELNHAWRVRPGMPELLADAAERGIGVAVVSNTLYGSVHRAYLDGAGLADSFAAQLYSDEAGVRKPNPTLARLALDALGVPAGEAWFVGDTRSRDVEVARRAGLGLAVLMRSLRRPGEGPEPDVELADPGELRSLLRAAK